mgnify:CR=1 FL=1
MARELGVSRQAVHDLVKRNIIPKDKDGLIDVELAKVALLNRVRPSGKTNTAIQEKSTGPTPAAMPIAPAADVDENTEITSYHVAKTLREAAEAQIARHKLGEMQQRLVEKTAVDKAFFEAARGLRDGMTNCSRRLAAEVATLSTPGECEEVIAKELRHLLDAFSRQLAQKIAPVPDTAPGNAET